MVKCWRCGTANDDDYTFCKGCGQSRIAKKGYLVIDQSGRTKFIKKSTILLVIAIILCFIFRLWYLSSRNYEIAEFNYTYSATLERENEQLKTDLSQAQTDVEELQALSQEILDSTLFMYTQEEVEELRQVYRDEMIADMGWIDQFGNDITTEAGYWKWTEWFKQNHPLK